MEELGTQDQMGGFGSKTKIFFISIFLGGLAIFLDIALDFIILGKKDFYQYVKFEITSHQFISTRLWALIFPVMGLIVHYYITSNTIEKKRVEEALEQTREQLFRAQKMEIMGQFIASIIHDFNNMLQVLSMNLDFMKFHCNSISHESTQDLLHSLGQIENTVGQTKGLVKQLLLFSKSDKKLDLEPIDVNEAIHETTSLYEELFGDNINIDFKLSNRPIVINANKSKLDQVLMNLFVNARDAMPDGGTLSISTDTQVIPDKDFQEYAMIKIKDSGVGMDKQMIKNAFEPFYSTKKEGTGLGLFTVHSIVKQYDGDISIQSQPGEGTTFRLFLPGEDH